MKNAMLALAGCLALAAPQSTPQKLEDQDTRASIGSAEPGHKSQSHRHENNRVMIHLDAGHQRLVFEDGKKRENRFKRGDIRWDPAGGMHTSENIGKSAYHIAQIEVKKPAATTPIQYPALDPIKADAKHYHVELDNAQVRVTRVRFAPKERVATHEHLLPRVTVMITDQAVRVTKPDGTSQDVRNPAGTMLKGGPAKHAEENLSDQPFEAVMVEFKGQ
ncbi:MAG: hypothetical protein IT162_00865 [Bryobacterales bacterium]|nr:hypothetical protein [Bryobacterales bacterium]